MVARFEAEGGDCTDADDLNNLNNDCPVAYFAEMELTVEVEREADGRWLCEVMELPGVLAYGVSEAAAIKAVEVLALRVLADQRLGPGASAQVERPLFNVRAVG